MRRSPWLSAAAVSMAIVASPALAVDLSKIERGIAKEPEYESKSPRYVLLVLGPDAGTRIWIVRDGATLYVDRNANGDLAEPGERLGRTETKVDPAPFETVTLKAEGLDGEYKLEVYGWGWLDHGEDNLDDLELSLDLTGPGKRRHGAWGDEKGGLTGARRPQEATVIHMMGPLQMGFEVREPLQPQEEDTYELNAAVGTPGLGAGSFSWLLYNAIPKDIHPVAVLEFPADDPSTPRVKVETVLDHRC